MSLYGNSAHDQALAYATEYRDEQPERLIAQALRRDLGVVLDPDQVVTFICKNWRLLDVCAHRIHGRS
jgi:hypothetical protein